MRWVKPSRMALKIYLIGIVQFTLVALVMDIDRRAGDAARRAEDATRRAEQAEPGLPSWSEPPPFPGPPGRGPHPYGLPDRPPPPDGPPPGPDGLPGPFGPPPGPPGPPGTRAPRPGPPFGLALGVVLVVGAVGSWLTARSFARPLETLARTARSFGAGDLETRSRMKRADEIGEVATAFDEMADRIAKLLLTERELLANVSHELRTPLARIRVALDLASEAEPQAAVESFADIAQDLAELERIVDDVLASARLAQETSTGMSLSIRSERVDLRELVERSARRFRSAHPTRPLDVELEQSASIVADPVLLRRVFDNLLDNAHKYSPDPDTRIVIAGSRAGDIVEVAITDHGIGISAEDQARLFEPFFRVDRSRTRATGGLGLGLVLARRIVEAHGGTLTLESALDVGTTMRVRLRTSRDEPSVSV